MYYRLTQSGRMIVSVQTARILETSTQKMQKDFMRSTLEAQRRWLKTSLFYMVVIASTVRLSAAAKEAKPEPATPPASDDVLVWKKQGGPDKKSDEVENLAPAAKKGLQIKQVTKDKKGKVIKSRDVQLLDPKLFFTGEVYFAKLNERVRQKPTFVHFLISGTAKEKPEDGTIINIDGAIIGFKAKRDEVTGRGIARLVALKDMVNGERVWAPAGINVLLGPRDIVTGSPPLAARLDYAHRTWSLYTGDIILAEGLPLFSDNGHPTVSIRAGAGPGDMAIIKKFELHDNPGGRSAEFIRSTNGKIDAVRAFNEGHPSVRKFSKGHEVNKAGEPID